MIHGSPAFETAIRGSYPIAVKAEAWIAGRRVASDLPLREDASISVDSGRFVRRQGRFSFIEDTARSTESLRELFGRRGVQIRVWRGVDFLGRPEYLPIHWGLVNKPAIDWPGKTVTVESPDLAQKISDDRFPAIRQSRAGFTIPQQIQQLAGESIPRLQFVDTTGSTAAVPAVTWERDRNAAMDKLAVSIGAESFLSPTGKWILRPVRTVLGIPVMRIREDQSLISVVDTVDWSEIRNDIIVTCERADGVQLTGRSTDNDPASQTWVSADGAGRHTGFYTTSLAVTIAQCNTIAAALRARAQGAQVSATYSTSVHPGVEAGDRHDVTHDGRTARLVVDSFELPVFGASMSLQGRMQVVPEGLE